MNSIKKTLKDCLPNGKLLIGISMLWSFMKIHLHLETSCRQHMKKPSQVLIFSLLFPVLNKCKTFDPFNATFNAPTLKTFLILDFELMVMKVARILCIKALQILRGQKGLIFKCNKLFFILTSCPSFKRKPNTSPFSASTPIFIRQLQRA